MALLPCCLKCESKKTATFLDKVLYLVALFIAPLSPRTHIERRLTNGVAFRKHPLHNDLAGLQ